MSQKNMAKRIGVSPSYYYKVESGYQNPSYEFLAKFKRSFPNASVDQIFSVNKKAISSVGTNGCTICLLLWYPTLIKSQT